MFPSDKYIKEFQETYEKEYGNKLTLQEAADAANNLLNFFKVLMDIDQRERRRKRRLIDEPKGFHITYGIFSCCVCDYSISGDQTWYDKNGLKCLNCQDALNKRLIPAYVCKNKDSWYQMWEFDSLFGVKAPTILKFVRQGKLKMRAIPDKNGGTHFRLFLIKDNVGVLPNKPRSRVVKVGENTYMTEYEKVPFPLLGEK